ncbi:unnamed protein product [Caenorhabditis sp. 36 PRJEB53466]|nr:unnamed protein product [Caenorhabditis sp. 36 PRJEB53466]
MSLADGMECFPRAADSSEIGMPRHNELRGSVEGPTKRERIKRMDDILAKRIASFSKHSKKASDPKTVGSMREEEIVKVPTYSDLRPHSSAEIDCNTRTSSAQSLPSPPTQRTGSIFPATVPLAAQLQPINTGISLDENRRLCQGIMNQIIEMRKMPEGAGHLETLHCLVASLIPMMIGEDPSAPEREKFVTNLLTNLGYPAGTASSLGKRQNPKTARRGRRPANKSSDDISPEVLKMLGAIKQATPPRAPVPMIRAPISMVQTSQVWIPPPESSVRNPKAPAAQKPTAPSPAAQNFMISAIVANPTVSSSFSPSKRPFPTPEPVIQAVRDLVQAAKAARNADIAPLPNFSYVFSGLTSTSPSCPSSQSNSDPPDQPPVKKAKILDEIRESASRSLAEIRESVLGQTGPETSRLRPIGQCPLRPAGKSLPDMEPFYDYVIRSLWFAEHYQGHGDCSELFGFEWRQLQETYCCPPTFTENRAFVPMLVAALKWAIWERNMEEDLLKILNTYPSIRQNHNLKTFIEAHEKTGIEKVIPIDKELQIEHERNLIIKTLNYLSEKYSTVKFDVVQLFSFLFFNLLQGFPFYKLQGWPLIVQIITDQLDASGAY